MTSENRAGKDWSELEIDLIVADYFSMRDMELRGERVIKARHNEALQTLTGRSRGSIEFKHQNISAVLMKLGEPWITGYKPMANFQTALLDGVERYLDQQNTDFSLTTKPLLGGVAEEGQLFLEQAPEMSATNTANTNDIIRLVRKFDPAARDKNNRALGKLGEERVVKSEKTRLRSEGRDDLADKVRWVSELDGDGAGYDILSFTAEGEDRFLEVKTTVGYQRTPFYISRNEMALSKECPDRFRLFRLYDFAKSPKAFVIEPPLKHQLVLEPTNYQASFS